MKLTDKFLLPKLTWWLLLLIPLVLFGFFPTYYGKLFDKLPSIYHVHATFMSLWVIMAIVQPYLINTKKAKMHRLIGKASYFIMPVVLFTAWLMIRHSYFLFITGEADRAKTERVVVDLDKLSQDAATYMRIGVLYWLWLLVFYTLAVVNRKRLLYHSTFMLAAVLTLLGPTVDRILYHVYGWLKISPDPFIATFLLIDILLLVILIYQRRNGKSPWPVFISLAIYLVGQLIFYFLPGLGIWRILIEPFQL